MPSAGAGSATGLQSPPAPDLRLAWERPLGLTMVQDGLAEVRVWAPRARSVTVRFATREHELAPAGHGVHEAVVPADEGDDYWLVLDGLPLPDPSSRWQPEGLRGGSRVLDARSLPAREDGFEPPALQDLVVYELHVGAFTQAGTFTAVAEHLPELAALGVTAIELMPVAEFPGCRGWGYDGVYISAAQSSYGGPRALAELVAAAHDVGLAVLLDVVYNHVGASGNAALEAFGPYFSEHHATPWGRALNYDAADCDPVREWVCQSAEGWVRDFGIDGLRLDALHSIYDSSAEHIVAAVARRVHDAAPAALVIAESGLNDPRVVREAGRGGWGCDAAWADDFHHALRALVSGERDGYYADFGSVAQLAKALHRPHVLDGCWSGFRRRRFGAPADDVPARRFVVFSQNHDQVGNRAFGDRISAAARPLAAFCALLSPFCPLLFMGEEYGELAPFQFFCDHIDPEVAAATRAGRRAEFSSFTAFGGRLPDPQDPDTFERSKLTRRGDPGLTRLYRELLAARRQIGPAEAREVRFDERERWLRLARGEHELAMNFGAGPLVTECGADAVELATDPRTRLSDGWLTLPPMAGALLR